MITIDTTTSAYRLLELTAISGECSPDALTYIGIRASYRDKLLTMLKNDGLLRTHYKHKLRDTG